MSSTRHITRRGVLISLFYITFCLGHDAWAQTYRTYSFSIENGKVRNGRKLVRVVKGDQLKIEWRCDQEAEIHLHGYDKFLNVSPDNPAVMRLEATATGRFPVTLHFGNGGHAHRLLLYLEVYPH